MKRLVSKTNKIFSKQTYGLPKEISASIFKIKKYTHKYLTSIFPASITGYKVIVYKTKFKLSLCQKIDLHLFAYCIGRKKIAWKPQKDFQTKSCRNYMSKKYENQNVTGI